MKETINDKIKIKKVEIKEIRKEYEDSVESKNLFKTPVLAGILALSYLGIKTFITYKLGIDVGDLSGYQQQVMSTMNNVAGITVFFGFCGALPATLCYKLDENKAKRKLEKEEKVLETLLKS